MDNKPVVVIRDDRSRATTAGAEDKSLAQSSEAGDWAGVPVPHCTGARISPDDNKVSDTAEDEGETEDGSTQFGESAKWSDISSDNSEVDSSCSVSDGAGGGRDKVGSSPSNRRLSNNIRNTEVMGRQGCRGRARGQGARFGRRIRTQRKNSDDTVGSHTEDVLKDKSGVPRTLSPSLRRTVNETALVKRGGSDAGGGVSDSDSVTSPSDLDDGDESDDDADTDDPLEPIPGEVKLVPSIFPDRPSTVFFEYPKELGMTRSDNAYFTEPLGDRRLLFKTHWERNSVKNAFFRAGFTRTTSTFSWTASWGKHPTQEGYKNLNRFQKVNHFPGSWCIGRKDRLLRTLARQKRDINSAAVAAATAAAAAAAREASNAIDRSSKGGEGGNGGTGYSGREVSTALSMVNPVDIAPEGFVLPGDRRAWMKAVEADPKAIWIVKPPASSCGRGIRVISKATAGRVSKSRKCLVQRYIHNPMLIDGRKFDLRLYVLVTSMEPLRVYLFEEGLVRLSTKRYSLKNLRSRYAHLTNYSINKTSASFKAPDDSDGQEATPSTRASKWALTIFWKYFENMFGVEKSKEVQQSIDDIVLRTMAAADGDMTISAQQVNRHRGCCYELFGFDVLLDEHLRPWLLEVNISPSLFGSSALDRRIKGTLMADIFHLVGFRPFDRTALRREERKEARRLPGTRRAVRAVVGKPQDAWRRCQTPASIKLSDLCEDEWEVIRDTEDEKHRAGNFRILYPTSENVIRLWPIFRNPRFLNGVLARWVLTGGLSSLSNRADIGLTAERLFFRKEMAYTGFGQRKYRGSGLGTRTGGVGDGRWEETTSNATTLISAGGAKLGSDGFPSSRSPRPASSATSRASQQRKRPLWRGANTKMGNTARSPGTTSGGADGGGTSSKQPLDGRCKGDIQGSKRTGKMPGMRVCRGGVKGIGESAAGSKKLVNVPRLRRNEDESSKGTSLRMIRSNAQLARINGGSHCSNGGSLDGNSALCRTDDRPSPVLKVRRASSALGARPSTGQSRAGEGGQRDCGVTAGISAFKDTGWGPVVSDRREAKATSQSETSKGRETSRRRSSQATIFQERPQKHVTDSGLDPTLYGHANLNSGAPEAVSSTEVALVNGCHFPRPPQPTPRCAADEGAGKSDPLNTFSVALLRSGRSRFASKNGAATSDTLPAAPFRCHALPDAYEGSHAGSNKIHRISSPGSVPEASRAPTGIGTEMTSLISRGIPGGQHRVDDLGATNHHPRRADVKEGTSEPFNPRSDHPPPVSLRGTRRGSQSVSVHEFEVPRLDKVGFTPRLDKRFSSDRRFQAANTALKPSAATAVTARSIGP